MLLILIILPIIVDANININVTILANASDIRVNVNYTGSDKKVVTERDLRLFNITTERLNKGVTVELGKEPKDIFLKDPTPYGKVFQKYKWEEMKRGLTVKKSKVIDILNEGIVLETHEHINLTPDDITTKRSMYKIIENRVSSTWSETGLPKDDIINYLNINFGYGHFKYEMKWRNESIQYTHMSIGMTKKGYITIKPNQTVVTKLTVSKTILLIEIMYEAGLTGQIVANYAQTYGKYHFWAPSVKSIMKAGAMNNEIVTTEVIEVRCFTNPRLDVYDKLTGEIIEPPKKKRLPLKISRNNTMTRILYYRELEKAKRKLK